jgi:hypothetical protein
MHRTQEEKIKTATVAERLATWVYVDVREREKDREEHFWGFGCYYYKMNEEST